MPRPQLPADDSLRLRIRRGELAQSERPDPAGELEAREPDELFEGAEKDLAFEQGNEDTAKIPLLEDFYNKKLQSTD